MWKHFDFVYKTFLGLKISYQEGQSQSYAALARYLGLSIGKIQKWRDLEQWPKAQDLAILHDKLGFSYRWLVTGEGEPFDEILVPPVQNSEELLKEDIDRLKQENKELTEQLLSTQKELIAVNKQLIELQKENMKKNSSLKLASTQSTPNSKKQLPPPNDHSSSEGMPWDPVQDKPAYSTTSARGAN